MRQFSFTTTITCVGNGNADLSELERLIDLHMQDLAYDDTVIDLLDEQEAVSFETSPIQTHRN